MHAAYLPSASLEDFVDSFFVIKKDNETNEFINELIVPDGTHGILFIEEGQILRSSIKGSQKKDCLKQTYIFGQKTNAVNYHFRPGPVFAYGAKLKPTALKTCFGISATELTNHFIEADLLIPGKNMHWCNQIYNGKTLVEKIKTLDLFLQHAAQSPNHQKALADAIIKFIHSKRGQLKVQDIASHFNLNYKYLERLFKQQIGMTPKLYCKIIRFNASLLYYREVGCDKLTDLAYTSGYFDQMHFIKEVKQFTGVVPSHFFKRASQPIAQQQTEWISKRLTA